MSKTRDRFSKGKRTENEHVRFLGISRKNANVLMCIIHPSHAVRAFQKTSSDDIGHIIPNLTEKTQILQ